MLPCIKRMGFVATRKSLGMLKDKECLGVGVFSVTGGFFLEKAEEVVNGRDEVSSKLRVHLSLLHAP